MTPDERNMLIDLANKVSQTPTPPKDPEAEDFIRTKIGSRPDALYIMTQTVLIQNLALEHAQEQIRDLQRRIPQPGATSGSSFLGQPAGTPRTSGAGYTQPGGTYAPPPPPPPQYTAPTSSIPSPGGAPSFLRGAAQTAAGVAAGALAFEGVRSLFEHPGYGGFGGGLLGGRPVEETVVNNYYDNPQQGGEDYRDDGRDDYQAMQDASNVQDASDYTDNGDDSGQYDDTSDFDNGDGGGFDDGSNFA